MGKEERGPSEIQERGREREREIREIKEVEREGAREEQRGRERD